MRNYTIFALFVLLLVSNSCNTYKSTGKNPSAKQKKAFKQNAHYSKGHFHNLESPPEELSKISFWKIMKAFRNKPETVTPPKPLPLIRTDLHTAFEKPTVVWFGHSSFLIKSKSANILVDPEFSSYAGPFKGVVKAFPSEKPYAVDDLPDIDVLIISHDHYDHLDYHTVLQLKNKVKKVVVPLGIGSHLAYWGYDPKNIIELKWEESVEISEMLKITVTPSHHTSQRKMFAKDKTLWGSFVIALDGYKLFYSGDTAYGVHFKKIGDQFGPFDLAMMECGQYNKLWAYHHMFPEQSAQAGKDMRAAMVLPVHWGKFAESTHPWNESIKRLLPVADSLHVPVTIPMLGQPYTVGSPTFRVPWWDF